MTPGKGPAQGGAMDVARMGPADAAPSTMTTARVSGPKAAIAPRRPAVSQGLVRGLQWAIAVIAVVAAIVGAIPFDADGSHLVRLGRWLVRELVPGVVTFAVVGLIVLRSPKARAVGWVMLSSAAAWGLSVLCAGLYIQPYDYRFARNPDVQEMSGILSSVGFYLIFIVLPQVFPDGLLRGWLWRSLLVSHLVLYLFAQGYVVWLFWPDSYPRPSSFDIFTLAENATNLWWYTGVAVVTAVFVARLRRGPRLARQQVAPFATVWLLSALAGELRYQGPEVPESTLAYMTDWLLPVAFAIVIGITATRVGLWDTRLVVRRFAVYAVMVGGLTVVFAGVYFAMLLALSSRAVNARYRWVALLVAAIAVLAAEPMRRRARTVLEHRLLGDRSEPLRSLARLDALSAGKADEPAIYQMITATVAEAVRAPGVSLALHQAPMITVVACTAAEPEDPLVLALLHRGERLGELRVAARTPGEPYGRGDRELLDQLSSQAAALVYGLRRDTDIDALRREAMEALVAQRMELGRDLHDGLGPLLAGAGLTADALRRGMSAGSSDADEAARLAVRLRTAASEVRRISHDLQPSGELPHLSSVILDYAGSVRGPGSPHIDVVLGDSVDEQLSAATELGLSRVALEAITNVIRHAHARRLEISLRRVGAELELTVTDDGVGLAQPYVSGIGVTSMRSRVQALGGTFELARRDGGGTVLMARVPLPTETVRTVVPAAEPR